MASRSNPLMVVALVLGGLLVLALAIAGYVRTTYNDLVSMQEGNKTAWAQVENQLQRRYDLIPNLVETVKGYASHEKGVFEEVTRARASAAGASGSAAAQAAAEGPLIQALGRLFAVAEAYPDLKANQNFLALQEELSTTENRIAFARQNYNDTTAGYNTRVQSFPANIVARLFNFAVEEYFELEDAVQREAPKVAF